MVSARLKGTAPVTEPTGEFTTFGCDIIANGTNSMRHMVSARLDGKAPVTEPTHR